MEDVVRWNVRDRERRVKEKRRDVDVQRHRQNFFSSSTGTNNDIPHRGSATVGIGHGHAGAAMMIEILPTVRIGCTHAVRIGIVQRWWHSLTLVRRIVRTRTTVHVTASHARIRSIGTTAAAARVTAVSTGGDRRVISSAEREEFSPQSRNRRGDSPRRPYGTRVMPWFILSPARRDEGQIFHLLGEQSSLTLDDWNCAVE